MILYGTVAALAFLLIKQAKRKYTVNRPFVSLIIPAKDEEANLPDCLKSVAGLTYPQNRLEIILVDDRSGDNTFEIMQSFAVGRKNVRVMQITQPPALTGKSSALAAACKETSGEWFFFTDADCVLPPPWIESMLESVDEKTGMIGASLRIEDSKKHERFFTILQKLDWIFFCTMGSVCARLRKPLSVFGNNMAIKKSVYDKAGGFEAAGKHVTEDFALMRLVREKTSAQIRFLLSPETTVLSRPCSNIAGLMRQRKRWAIGTRDRDSISLILLGTVLLEHALLIISGLIGEYAAMIGLFVWMTFWNGLLIFRGMQKAGISVPFWWMIPYELFLILYSLILTPSALFAKTVQWKSEPVGR